MLDIRLIRENPEKINELLKQSIKSDGVINLFQDVKEEFSLFDPKFLDEISKMKEKIAKNRYADEKWRKHRRYSRGS